VSNRGRFEVLYGVAIIVANTAVLGIFVFPILLGWPVGFGLYRYRAEVWASIAQWLTVGVAIAAAVFALNLSRSRGGLASDRRSQMSSCSPTSILSIGAQHVEIRRPQRGHLTPPQAGVARNRITSLCRSTAAVNGRYRSRLGARASWVSTRPGHRSR